MSRTPNALPSVTLRISITPQIETRLDRLIETGFFGKNRAEAAERLISERLRELDAATAATGGLQ